MPKPSAEPSNPERAYEIVRQIDTCKGAMVRRAAPIVALLDEIDRLRARVAHLEEEVAVARGREEMAAGD